MKALFTALILFTGTFGFANTLDESLLATPREFLNFRWQHELSSIKNFKAEWLKLAKAEEFHACKEQNGSRWKWLSYDKCERHREILREELYKIFELNRSITKRYDMYVNNIDDALLRNSAPVQKSRSLNYDAFHAAESAISMCLESTDALYTTEHNYRNNVNYFNAGLRSINCYYNYTIGRAKVVSGDSH